MERAVVALTDVQHSKLCYSKERMCAHPRQCPIHNYGDGHITVIHHHAPSAYRARNDIQHGQFGYKGRAKILLQRSFDHGETWPSEQEVVIWDDSLPLEEKRAILRQADDPTLPREEIDLSSPDSSVYFARPATGPERADGRPALESYAFRSGDRGHTWETVPTRINPPTGLNYVHIDGGPWVQYGDGTQLVVASIGSDAGNTLLGIYGTDDNGLSWNYLAEVANDPTGRGRPTYAVLLPLPSGRLQCYMLNIQGIRNAIQMNYSDDGATAGASQSR